MSEPVENQTTVAAQATDATPTQVPAATSESGASPTSSDPSGSTTAPPEKAAVESASSSERPGGPATVAPSTCSCGSSGCTGGCGGGSPQLIYALGQLGFDFATEARRDSIMQQMGEGANPYDPEQLLSYLKDNPSDAAAILWTLNLDATSIYVIQGQGAFASQVYERLRDFLKEQIEQGVERVSVPGYIAGNARLMNGQVVPVIRPELRGMFSWTTSALVNAVCGSPPPKREAEEIESYARNTDGVRNFLERVYHELRNLGTTPQGRAINFSATNAFSVSRIFESALKDGLDLDTIEVERSPICRPESDCWDVKLTFFNPTKVFEQARKVYRFTVDVSDVVPVTVGPVRSWFVR